MLEKVRLGFSLARFGKNPMGIDRRGNDLAHLNYIHLKKLLLSETRKQSFVAEKLKHSDRHKSAFPTRKDIKLRTNYRVRRTEKKN